MSVGAGILDDATLAVLAYAVAVNLLYLAAAFGAVRRSGGAQRQSASTAREIVLRSPLTPPVSIVVAVRNDEASVVDRVRCLLQLRYPDHEVIVVDAGSEDHTLDRLDEAFRLAPTTRALRDSVPAAPARASYRALEQVRLVVLAASGGSRGDALNLGIRAARHAHVLVVARDAMLGEDALLAAVQPLAEDGPADAAVLGVAERLEQPGGCFRSPAQGFGRLDALRSAVLCRAGVGGATACAFAFLRAGFLLCSRSRAEGIGGFDVLVPDPDLDLLLRLDPTTSRSHSPLRTVHFDEPLTRRPDTTSLQELLYLTALERAATIETLRLARARRIGGKERRSAVPIVALALLVPGPVVTLLPPAIVVAALVSGCLSSSAGGVFVALAAGPGLLLVASALALAAGVSRSRRPRHLLTLVPLAPFFYLGYRQCVAVSRLAGTLLRTTPAARGSR